MVPLGPPNYAPGDINPLTRWGGLVSRETVVLRRWGRETHNFGFINGVDKVNWPT